MCWVNGHHKEALKQKIKPLQQRMGKKCRLGWRWGLCPSDGWMWHGVYGSVLSQSELLDWSFWSAWLRSFTLEMKELSIAALRYSSSGVRVEASLPILSPRAKCPETEVNLLSCLNAHFSRQTWTLKLSTFSSSGSFDHNLVLLGVT